VLVGVRGQADLAVAEHLLVAPDERRQKVLTEVNRPTFSRLSPPLNQISRFVAFCTLRERLEQLGSMVTFLKPEFVRDGLSESCAIDSV
jgi:hypothetical protein